MSAMPSSVVHRVARLLGRVGAACAVALACTGNARADVVADAFETVRQALASPSWSAQLEAVSDRSVTVALSAMYRNGECRVFILESSAYLTETLLQLERDLRRPYLEGLFAHELAHCDDMHTARATPGVLDAGSSPLNVVAAYRRADGELAVDTLPRRVLWAEILADAALALYLAERHPAIAEVLIDFHLARRAQRAVLDPDHDTSRYLEGRDLRRHGDEDLRDAAWRVRRESVGDAFNASDRETRITTR